MLKKYYNYYESIFLVKSAQKPIDSGEPLCEKQDENQNQNENENVTVDKLNPNYKPHTLI